MKKHQIDNFLAEKLSQAEIQPSMEAWTKLERRTQSKKRAITFWPQWGSWVAAASVVLFIIGFWVLNNNTDLPKPSIALKETPKKKIQTEKPTTEKQLETKQELSIAHAPTIQKPTKAIKVKGAEKINSVSMNNELRMTNVPQNPQVIQMINDPVKNIDLTVPAVIPNEKLIAEIKLIEEVKEKTVIIHLPEIIENDQPTQNVVAQQQPKSNRFGRIFKQIKNFKQGERVEWDEVGLNPNRLLARVNKNSEQTTTNN